MKVVCSKFKVLFRGFLNRDFEVINLIFLVKLGCYLGAGLEIVFETSFYGGIVGKVDFWI
jgi:hypothetical protein